MACLFAPASSSPPAVVLRPRLCGACGDERRVVAGDEVGRTKDGRRRAGSRFCVIGWRTRLAVEWPPTGHGSHRSVRPLIGHSPFRCDRGLRRARRGAVGRCGRRTGANPRSSSSPSASAILTQGSSAVERLSPTQSSRRERADYELFTGPLIQSPRAVRRPRLPKERNADVGPHGLWNGPGSANFKERRFPESIQFVGHKGCRQRWFASPWTCSSLFTTGYPGSHVRFSGPAMDLPFVTYKGVGKAHPGADRRT
jgi:hypothetical protein